MKNTTKTTSDRQQPHSNSNSFFAPKPIHPHSSAGQNFLANQSYQSFVAGKPARLLPETVTLHLAPSHHNHSLLTESLEASAMSLFKTGMEHQLHHKLPRVTATAAAAIEAFEVGSNFSHRKEKSITEGKSEMEANTCAYIGSAVELGAKTLSYGVVTGLQTRTKGLLKVGTFAAASPFIEAGAISAGNVMQHSCHVAHDLGRETVHMLSKNTKKAQADTPQPVMPSMRKF
jgi:hypothetical protein